MRFCRAQLNKNNTSYLRSAYTDLREVVTTLLKNTYIITYSETLVK